MNNETALEMCLRMFKERADWYENSDSEYEIGVGRSYCNAATMLEYAMQNNIECLRKEDYCLKKE
jgi:hypothetical protein